MVDIVQQKPAIRILRDGGELPDIADIEELYASASEQPPLSESREVAQSFARLYGYARRRGDTVCVSATTGNELVGFAYGHPWSWVFETDAWSAQLRERLGPAPASEIEAAFAVLLLVVHPSAAHRGVGSELLKSLMDASGTQTHWLQTTDKDTPALRLYQRFGFQPLGHGPDAPNGEPGLVLIHRPRMPADPSTAASHFHRPHFSSRDSTRSASGFPPVWQVGQY